jgi:uncharacterized protein involved in exopolysaccharide biosynthesis
MSSIVTDSLVDTGSTPSLLDTWHMLVRRAKLVGLTAGGLASMALIIAFAWPPVYRSSATILIEQQEIPTEMVRSTITTYADQRIQSTSQRVMTSTHLMEIVDKFNLYPERREREPREALVQRMRKDIKMDLISADVMDPRFGRPTQATIAFSVSYESRAPDLAQKVASEITTLYLNENLKTRTESTRETSTFLTEEAEKLREQTAAAETKLADFKRRHVHRLPELVQLNFQLLDRTERDLAEVDRDVRALEERKAGYLAQLAHLSPNAPIYNESGEHIVAPGGRLKALQSREMSMAALYAPDHPDLLKARKEIAGLKKELGVADNTDEYEARLDDARAELAKAREKYTADHPDVRRLTRRVESLEKGLAREQGGAVPTESSIRPDNPAYLQIQAQIKSADHQLEILRKRREELTQKLSTYETRLSETPKVESQYRALVREQESAQRKYQELRAKEMEAQMAQSLESERKGERFTLIEPPQLPEEPVRPKRTAIVLAGLALSMAGGLGAGIGAEALDGSVRAGRQAGSFTRAPLLATIPYIENASDRARRRERHAKLKRVAWIAAGVLLVALVLFHFFVKPFDVLGFVLARRLGF